MNCDVSFPPKHCIRWRLASVLTTQGPIRVAFHRTKKRPSPKMNSSFHFLLYIELFKAQNLKEQKSSPLGTTHSPFPTGSEWLPHRKNVAPPQHPEWLQVKASIRSMVNPGANCYFLVMLLAHFFSEGRFGEDPTISLLSPSIPYLFFSFSVIWLFSLLSNRHWWALPSNKVYCQSTLGDWKPDYPVYPLPRILSLFLLYWVCSLTKGKYLKFLSVLLFIFYLLKGELFQNENLKLSVDSVTIANWSAS